MKLFPIFVLALLSFFSIEAQTQYFTRTGYIHVSSSNKYMDVEADNYQVFGLLNAQTGEIQFTALVKSFEFQLGAAQRVMNSERLNVSQYPKVTYEGKIKNLSAISFNKPGTYTAKMDGWIYMWDAKRKTPATATFVVNEDGSIEGNSALKIVIEEESVERINQLMKERLPSVVSVDVNKLGISRDINITADLIMKPRG